jgi:hypothetical protein
LSGADGDRTRRAAWLSRFGLHLLAVTLAFVACLPLVPGRSAVAAQSAPPPEAREVRVGIYLLHVGRLDTSDGTYNMDFFLIVRCPDRPCPDLSPDLLNGHAAVFDPYEDEPHYKVWRIEALLWEPMHLREYPFDRHTLSVVLEDRHLTADQLVFVPDLEHTMLDPEVDVAGWQLVPGFSATVAERYLKPFEQTYSQYTFAIEVRRPLLAAIMQGLIPPLVIVWLAFCAFLLSPDKWTERLGVHTSAVIASVLYHLSLNEAIPPTAYLTFADGFMILNHAWLGVTLASTLVMMRLWDREQVQAVHSLDYWSSRLIPVGWVLLQAVIALLIAYVHHD